MYWPGGPHHTDRLAGVDAVRAKSHVVPVARAGAPVAILLSERLRNG